MEPEHMYIAVLTIVRHWSLSWARCIQPRPSHSISFFIFWYYPPCTARSSKWSLSFRFSD